MELEEHINKLKIGLQAFNELIGPSLTGPSLTLDQAVTLAQSAHKEWALDQRTEYIRESGAKPKVTAEERDAWRQEPATEKQIALLKKRGVEVKSDLTKGEASEIIKSISK